MTISKRICFFLLRLMLSIHPNAKYTCFSSRHRFNVKCIWAPAEKCEANVGTRIYLFEHCNINRVHQFKERVNYFMAVHLHITCSAMDVCCDVVHTLTYTPYYRLYCCVLTLHCRHTERTLYNTQASERANIAQTHLCREWMSKPRARKFERMDGEMETQESHSRVLASMWPY